MYCCYWMCGDGEFDKAAFLKCAKSWPLRVDFLRLAGQFRASEQNTAIARAKGNAERL